MLSVIYCGKSVILVLIIKERATLEQVEQMLQTLGLYIKIAVDIKREILAGGGEKYAYCEAALLEDGSRQKDTALPAIMQYSFPLAPLLS